MMRVFVIELLICGVLLLTGCNTTAEKASDPNVFNCEESYTYSQETYSSDDIYYDYQEPHKTVENTLGIEEDIAFLYTYDYPDEGIGNGLIIMNNGDIFLADINVFDYVDNANFGEFQPIKNLEENIMNNYLEALDNVVPCKPVNVDERSSYTEETKRYINIYGMRDGYQIKLFHSGDNIEISTDENATKIVEWMEQLYSGIFSK